MIVKMLWRLENRMGKMQETFNTVNTITKDIEEIKNKQRWITQLLILKNTLEGTNSRITEAEERKSELEDRTMEIPAKERTKWKEWK